MNFDLQENHDGIFIQSTSTLVPSGRVVSDILGLPMLELADIAGIEGDVMKSKLAPGHTDLVPRKARALSTFISSQLGTPRDLTLDLPCQDLLRNAGENTNRTQDPIASGAGDGEEMSSRLMQLAPAFRSRFTLSEDPEDADNAIIAIRLAAHLTPPSHPEKSLRMLLLGCLLIVDQPYRNVVCAGAATDEAITSLKEALDLARNIEDKAFCASILEYTLQRRFSQYGLVTDIDEAIDVGRSAINLAEEGHLNPSGYLNDLAEGLRHRFEVVGDRQDIDESIEASHLAIRLASTGDVSGGHSIHDCVLPFALVTLSASLLHRFELLGNIDDLEDAISSSISAVDLLGDDGVANLICITNLANALQVRFERSGDVHDIDAAINIRRHALRHTPQGSELELRHLLNLGISIERRYTLLGNQDDLSESISSFRRAAEAESQHDHLHLSRSLSNLAAALSNRFMVSGDIRDIEDAILINRHSASLVESCHPDKPKHLTNLSAMLSKRFQRFGYGSDIDEAIAQSRHAVELVPSGHKMEPFCWFNLGALLQTRFATQSDKRIDDIEESVFAHHKASELTLDTDRWKARYLSELGYALRQCFTYTGEEDDIFAAMQAARRAIALLPDDSPEKPERWNKLGAIALTRFVHPTLGTFTDIDESIHAYDRANSLTARDRIHKSMYLLHLGESYSRRLERSSDPADFYSAYHYLMSASSPTLTGPPAMKLLAVQCCIQVCQQYADRGLPLNLLLDAHAGALALVQQVTWLGHDLKRRFQELINIGSIVNDAAAYAISVGRAALALEWLEEGRAIIWRQILKLRTPLDDLRLQYPELADQLERAAAKLELAGQINAKPDSRASMEQESQRHRLIADEYERILEHVRALEGFESFLRPKTISQLALAAKSGHVVLVNMHPTRSDALVLSHSGSVTHVPLKDSTYEFVGAMRTQLSASLWKSGLRSRGAAGATSESPAVTFEPILGALWQNIVEPVLRSLNQLRIRANFPIPLGAQLGLAFLPLHAAGDYGSRARVSASDFVVSSYTPTLDMLLRQRDVSCNLSKDSVLIISQPDAEGYSCLPGVREEVDKVSMHFANREVLHREHATVNATLEAMAQHNFVHFACHGIQMLEDPTKSAFILHDGKLELSRLMSKSMEGADLAVLSACQTATGTETLPDEAMHLAASMLAAGYRSVVGTMWSIGDEDAPIVADAFYSKLKELREEGGQGSQAATAYALHAAVGVLRKHVGERNFLKWVPFVHFGL